MSIVWARRTRPRAGPGRRLQPCPLPRSSSARPSDTDLAGHVGGLHAPSAPPGRQWLQMRGREPRGGWGSVGSTRRLRVISRGLTCTPPGLVALAWLTWSSTPGVLG